MPVLTATERLGTSIDGTYLVENILAQGGMGVVFRATHRWTGRRVALKLLKPDLVEPARNVRLVQEARAAAAVSHPNVVQILDMGLTEDGVSYLVMELLEGRTLKDELQGRGTLGVEETLAILLPLAGAMAVAHDRGIVHRDLKPANVFLSVDAGGRMTPKLLDFGIAKVIEESGITRTGTVLGTPSYLSPEQAAGETDIGPEADVWAFGVIAFECLSGRLPFAGARSAAVMQRIANENAPPLRSVVPALGGAFAAALDRALRRDRHARYPDMRSFAHAVVLTAHDDGIELPADPDPIGLPEWAAWCRAGGDGATTAEIAAPPVAGNASRRRAGLRPAWWLAALAAGLAAYAAHHTLRDSPPAPSATPPPAVPIAAPVPARIPGSEPARAAPMQDTPSAAPIAAPLAAPAPAAAPAAGPAAAPPAAPTRVSRRRPQRAKTAPTVPTDAPDKRTAPMLPW